MMKYMLVYVTEDGQDALFGNDYLKMCNSKMDIECGLGGCAELYERVETECGMAYVLVES